MVSLLQYQPSTSAANLTSAGSSQGLASKGVATSSGGSSIAQGGSSGCGNLTPTNVTGGPVDEDDSLEQDLKVAHVEMYKLKLRERERRRRVAREHMVSWVRS